MPTANNELNNECGHDTYKMLIKPSVEFCELLFRKYDGINISHINSESDFACDESLVCDYISPLSPSDHWLKKILCNLFGCVPKEKKTLVGYIIKPSTLENLPSEKSISSPTTLSFHPVWVVENKNGYKEEIEFGILFEYSLISLSQEGEFPGENAVLAKELDLAQSVFDKEDIQYASGAIFNKGFVSRHDLFLIANYSEYIGIVGAKISMGNFISYANESRPPINCNKDYFTYRLVGLCKDSNLSKKALKNNIVLVPSNGKKCGQPSKMGRNSLLRGDGEHESSTQTSTHSNPCPPSWDEQP